MKLRSFSSALILAGAVATQGASADAKTASEIQAAATFTTSAIVGGIAGGPVGFFLGALGGAFLGEQGKKAASNKEALIQAQSTIAQLEIHAIDQERSLQAMASRVAGKLEFQTMFSTGDDQLSQQDMARLQSLADYLARNPELRVRLDGHTDPRGTDEYNNVLSQERAKAVAAALEESGIDPSRMDIYAHGSSFAMATEANRDNYAFERRVNIEVYDPNASDVAAAN